MTPIYWNLVFTAQSGLKSSRPAASATLRSAPRAPAVGNAGGGANLNVGGAQRESGTRRRRRRRRPTRSSPPWALPSIVSALAADLMVGVMTDDTSSRTLSCRDRVHRQGRGFKVIRQRWVIERTFSWLRHNRRLMARRAGDGRCPLRQARNDLPHAQATDLRLAMISNANFRFRPNSRVVILRKAGLAAIKRRIAV